MRACFTEARAVLKHTIFESRVDSAFFNEEVLTGYNRQGVQFSASVPFERFPALKAMVESRRRWKKIDSQWSYFENPMEAQTLGRRRLSVHLHPEEKQTSTQGSIQLDLFEPRILISTTGCW